MLTGASRKPLGVWLATFETLYNPYSLYVPFLQGLSELPWIGAYLYTAYAGRTLRGGVGGVKATPRTPGRRIAFHLDLVKRLIGHHCYAEVLAGIEGVFPAGPVPGKIGRASCRERV